MSFEPAIEPVEGPRLAFVPVTDANAIAEHIVAFANTEGGTIVVGVNADDGAAQTRAAKTNLERTLGLLDNLYNPPVVLDSCDAVRLQRSARPDNASGGAENTSTGSDLPMPGFAIRVPRSTELHALADGRILIRSGAANRPLAGQEILRLASAKNTGDFETEAVPGATTDDFNRELIDEYLDKRAQRAKRAHSGDINPLLAEIGAITADGKPTVCGLLLFSDYPQRWLPQSSVVFVRFLGTTPRGEHGLAGYIRREEISGSAPRLIESAWNLVWSEMAISAVVKGLEREETLEYPQFAVREALVNAICHRDYRLRGRRIEVRMFSDRLEVISPGGLPGFITVENIKDEHFSRNPRLVGGLFHWGYIEELGLGIDRMLEVMEQAGHSPPRFDARPYSFAVALHNERIRPLIPDWARGVNHRQARALQYVRDRGTITNREYRGLVQSVSAETLRLDLADLVDKGILNREGANKGTRYTLREEAASK
ncbi:MAG: hypothetical protein F4X02_09225 [Chloroflexi bacterium]|nr:hypothetical protein [Chloroflexota bacterium]